MSMDNGTTAPIYTRSQQCCAIAFVAVGSLICIGLFVGLVVGIVVVVLIDIAPVPATSKDPTFTVESTAVKAYNLTSNNRLFILIDISVRTRNPIARGSSLIFQQISTEVMKRSRENHVLAKDVLRDLILGPGEEALVHVEAMGLGQVALDRKTAEGARADVAAGGEGRVNVFIYATVWGPGRGNVDYLDVTCKDVVVHFNRSMDILQRVNCNVLLLV